MSEILRANVKQEIICVPDLSEISGLSYQIESPSLLLQKNGKKIKASCINCHNPRCMRIFREEIECKSFPGMSHDMTMAVCPVDAIKQESNQIRIDERKCFGCGLCVSRCPVGALYLKDGRAEINIINELPVKKLKPNTATMKEQTEIIRELLKLNHIGSMTVENESVMDKIYKKIRKLSHEQQNRLARNILIALANNATVSRHGDVYLRMDGYYENLNKHGVIEVETGTDMLDVSRAILDDIAVLSARHNIDKEDNSALAICLNLANRRTDYWQEVKDIKDVTGIRISTVTFAILLIYMWNGLLVNDFDIFYIDVDNSSLRKEAEKILGRKIHISIGHEGMIENSK